MFIRVMPPTFLTPTRWSRSMVRATRSTSDSNRPSARCTWMKGVAEPVTSTPEEFGAFMKAELAKYPNLKEIRWVQDEPANMGPWPHYQLNVWPGLDKTVEPVTRPESASPSVGTIKRHAEEQKSLMAAAFESVADRTVQGY